MCVERKTTEAEFSCFSTPLKKCHKSVAEGLMVERTIVVVPLIVSLFG